MTSIVDVQKPELVVLSSGKVAHSGITGAIRDELNKRGFTVTLWEEGFFPTNEIALNAFLKQLLCYDAALLVLGDDDVRLDPSQADKKQRVPRDNVIFELGACMSRLGPKKTFIVRPESPEVVLPSYFHGVGGRLTYETTRVDRNLNAAVGSACDAVAREFANFDRTAFFSDLPASGLAFGYFHNFLQPTYSAFSASGGPALLGTRPTTVDDQERERQEGGGWNYALGFKLSVVIPEAPLSRDQVQRLFTDEPVDLASILYDSDLPDRLSRRLRFVRLQVALNDGRNISIYSKSRDNLKDPFHIFDVPTTLLTSQEVISDVDAFWGAGDTRFRERLSRREALNFWRTLSKLKRSKGASIDIISMAEFKDIAFQS